MDSKKDNFSPKKSYALKEPCKKYHALTGERLPQVESIPKNETFSFNKKVLGISKLHFIYNENFKWFSLLMKEITILNYVAQHKIITLSLSET